VSPLGKDFTLVRAIAFACEVVAGLVEVVGRKVFTAPKALAAMSIEMVPAPDSAAR
jgi:hypothetical protein